MKFRIIAAGLAVIATTNSAYAYLDPGAGSFALQMIAAGLLAGGASLKLYWFRIKDFFVTRRRKASHDN
ncbi:MAG: hypothetical protein Q7T86_18310 [Hyphomicrobiaceae bacterium]|nr:hypothetical protein [Hyphomicrobiaceae bacterium]